VDIYEVEEGEGILRTVGALADDPSTSKGILGECRIHQELLKFCT
jgi:hypothetical protein